MKQSQFYYLLRRGLFGGGGIWAKYVNDFKARVIADGGTMESPSCAKTDVKFLVQNPEPSAFDADYQAVLDRSTALGYTAPSAAQQTLQNTLVEDLKTAGVWDKLDLFYVFATDGDSDYATLNWKTPASFQATKVNSPTFISNEGYQGDGSSSHLDTNFNPNTHSTASSQYSIGAGGYNFQKPTSTYDNIIGVDNANSDLLIATRFTTDQPFFRVNDAGTFRPTFVATAGFYGVSRSANNRIDAILPDGTTASSTNAGSAGLPNGNLTILNWGAAVRSNAKVSVAYYGGDLTSEHSDFKTAIDTYIAGL